jgi:hypothetical protein
VWSFVLAQRVGKRTPYDRRDIALSLLWMLAGAVLMALIGAWWVHVGDSETHEVVAFVALPVGSALGGLAGGLLADARRRRSGATD